MNGLSLERPSSVLSHNPAKMVESKLDGVPDSWRQTMLLERPNDGINICSMYGRPSDTWVFQSETEPALSMSFLLEGRIEAAIEDGVDLRLKDEQVLLMASNQPIGGWDVFSAEKDFKLVNVHITAKALEGLTGMAMPDLLQQMRSTKCDMPHVDACMSTLPLSSSLRRLAAEIVHCQHRYTDNAPLKKMFLCAKATEALATIIHSQITSNGNISTLRALPTDRPKLVRAKALLENSYNEAWTVSALAQAVGLNEKRLQAGFQTLFGYSVHESLTRIRIDVALAMLAHGFSVTHTAQSVGFSNISHFSKTFSQQIGVSPKRWAKEWLLNKTTTPSA
ncbi:helix-turn-helix transcriptional regulator [Paenalcaligenes sp. Me131]|uniref:helix-turn-helix transcriptional regulator n=1 Tax=Paenalcaligenes sp. Me131 TaxID=3392636 RepID=UPI003D27B674